MINAVISLPPSSPSPQGGDESPTRPPGLPSRRKATLPNAPQTWLDRAEAYQQLQQRGPGEHLRMQPSPATRVLRNRNAAVGVDAKDDDDDDDDRSVSDFSTTEADTRARLEKEFPAAVDYEEQDEEDFEAMEAETTARAKRKGKSKAVEEDAESHTGEDEEGEPESDGEEDEDEDEDEGVAWDLKPGPLGEEDLEKAHEARRAYQKAMHNIARGAGKRVSALFKAVGNHKTRSRTDNPWNAFQVKYRVDHPKPKEMSVDEYKGQCKDAYAALFEDIPEDDEKTRNEIKSGLLAWYAGITAVVLEGRKASGHRRAVMNKVVKPFIRESTLTYQTSDVDVFGFAIDSFTAEATKLLDFSAMLRMVKMARREAEGSDAQPVIIDFTPHPGDKKPDVFTRTIGCLFLNSACLVFRERDEEPPSKLMRKSQFSWTFADVAVTYHLRIKNWPIALKSSHPGKSFSLKSIKGDAKKQWYKLWEAMKAKYHGKNDEEDDDDDTVEIESWSEEEMALEGAALAKVPIITGVDGSTLLYAKDAPKLIKQLGGVDLSDEEDGDNDKDARAQDEEEDDRVERPQRPLPRRPRQKQAAAADTEEERPSGNAQPSRKRAAAGPPEEEPAPKRPTPPAPITQGDVGAPSTSRLTLPIAINHGEERESSPVAPTMCRWVNGTRRSKPFPVDDLSPVAAGKTFAAEEYARVEVSNGEEWIPLPQGIVPILTDEQAKVAAFYRKLLKF
ncbi:hypothetical protein FB45DRAFT_872537 [Roridomyces roridus]|uniref:Uncharacterized protein n=1 Tax=Roridomyces roridus TaxID=1738132 RepID=A0AAD7BCL7_9AGAR|nr:hypothetical protein FB45DRAFT_872537 [Roridomyces roridus]